MGIIPQRLCKEIFIDNFKDAEVFLPVPGSLRYQSVNGKFTSSTPEQWRIWNAAKSNSWPSEGAPDVKEDELEELPSFACPGAPDIKCDGKTCIITCVLTKRSARLTCNT